MWLTRQPAISRKPKMRKRGDLKYCSQDLSSSPALLRASNTCDLTISCSTLRASSSHICSNLIFWLCMLACRRLSWAVNGVECLTCSNYATDNAGEILRNSIRCTWMAVEAWQRLVNMTVCGPLCSAHHSLLHSTLLELSFFMSRMAK